MIFFKRILHQLICLVGNHYLCLTPSRLIQSLTDIQIFKNTPQRTEKRLTYFYLTKVALYGYWLWELARLHYIGALLASGGSLAAYLPWDPYNGVFFLKLKFFNHHTTPVIVLGCLIVIYIDFVLYFQLDSFSLKLFQELAVENRRHFWALNLQKEARWSIRRPVSSVVQLKCIFHRLWNKPKKLTFANVQLSTFPNLSLKTRARMVVIFMLIDVLAVFINVCAGILFALLLAYHLSIVYQTVGGLSSVYATFDAFFFFTAGFNAIRIGVITALSGGATSFVTKEHLKEVTTSLARLIYQAKHEGVSSLRLEHQLAFYRTEHRHILRLVGHLNESLVSRLMMGLFMTNLTFNIVALNVLLNGAVDLVEMVFLVCMIAIEGLLPLEAFSILVSWSDSLYKADRLLYRAQAALTRSANVFTYPRVIGAKLKLMNYFELVCTKSKFRFTIGPWGRISKRALYEFTFAYSGAFMFISKLMRKLQAYEKNEN